MTPETRKTKLFELKLAINTDADNFTSQLIRLMLKADRSNLAKLAVSFPDEAEIVRDFKNGLVSEKELQ
jgi:hypothetical protein